jgi:hypothetical protein
MKQPPADESEIALRNALFEDKPKPRKKKVASVPVKNQQPAQMTLEQEFGGKRSDDRLEWPEEWFEKQDPADIAAMRKLWKCVLIEMLKDATAHNTSTGRSTADLHLARSLVTRRSRDLQVICDCADIDLDFFVDNTAAKIQKLKDDQKMTVTAFLEGKPCLEEIDGFIQEARRNNRLFNKSDRALLNEARANHLRAQKSEARKVK